MKSNKGFTLVELLAVIVILAIVALVATPVILNIITSNTNKANDSSKRLIIKSVELSYTAELSENNGSAPKLEDVITQFNGTMDDNTKWNGNKIENTGSGVSCDVNASGTTLSVQCTLSDDKIAKTKDLTIQAVANQTQEPNPAP